jgi:uncharacterized protein YbjT (DUF2867 family)
MSGFKSFAVVGAGTIGGPIIKELLKAKSAGVVDKVVVLSRPGSEGKLDSYTAEGAAVVFVDYSSVSAVTEALAGVEVVISTLPASVLDKQLSIAKAAKAADAQLFVPSEFGVASDVHTEGLLAAKSAISNEIHASGLAVTRFFTGNFADWIWNGFVFLDLKSGSVTVGEDGNSKISFTSRTDIARFVVHVLTALPKSETVDKTFRIEADRISFNEVFAAYEKKHNTKLQVKYLPIKELTANVDKDPYDVVSLLHRAWATGEGTVGTTVSNDLFPDWNPTPVIEYI